jgi:hypothetical protein
VVDEGDSRKPGLYAEHLAEEVQPSQERFTPVPVNLDLPPARPYPRAIVAGALRQDQRSRPRIDHLAGAMVLKTIRATEVAAEGDLYLRDDRNKNRLRHGSQ